MERRKKRGKFNGFNIADDTDDDDMVQDEQFDKGGDDPTKRIKLV